MTTMLILLAALVPIRGTVRDAKGDALPGVTVFVKGSQTSVVTDAGGAFELVPDAAPAIVVAYLGGFQPKEIEAQPGAELDLRLDLAVTESMTVTASADRDVPMSTYTRRPLDIVRTPGAQGDVFRALQTLPGVARADDGAGLFVRGGDVSEVRVLLDGTTIAHPYRYETPSGGQAGAVEPFLLEGIAFSTGGFSARHGNALSAIVDLRGLGRPSSSALTATVGLAGASMRGALPGDASSGLRVSGNLRFPRLLFAVNGAPREFDRYPDGWDLNASLHRESRFGTLKLFVMEQRTGVGVRIEREAFDGFLHAETSHGVVAASWKHYLAGWQMSSSLGADRYANRTDAGVLDLTNEDRRLSWRVDLARPVGAFLVRTGIDADHARHDIRGQTSIRGGDFGGVSGTRPFDVAYRDGHAGVYAEAERTFGRVTPTLGARVDASQRSGAWFDPRANVTVALRKNEQLRFAWGIYHQAPASSYFDVGRASARPNGLKPVLRLRPMRAVHWIAGYEYGNPEAWLHARVEAYRKTYAQLPLEEEDVFTSNGHGSAQGVDVYVQRQWTRLGVRGSYAYVDARRRWTPHEQRQRFAMPDGTWRPDFWIPHSLTLAATFNPTPRIALGAAYSSASGRPTTPITGALETAQGFVPLYGALNSDRLPRYERIDFSSSYRRRSLLYILGISNVLARENSFEYAYSRDYSEKRPVVSAAPRSVYVALSWTKQ
jgi:vitamin B12 transporter